MEEKFKRDEIIVPYYQRAGHTCEKERLFETDVLHKVLLEFPDRHEKHVPFLLFPFVLILVLFSTFRTRTRREVLFLLSVGILIPTAFRLLDGKTVQFPLETELETIQEAMPMYAVFLEERRFRNMTKNEVKGYIGSALKERNVFQDKILLEGIPDTKKENGVGRKTTHEVAPNTIRPPINVGRKTLLESNVRPSKGAKENRFSVRAFWYTDERTSKSRYAFVGRI